MLKAFNTIVSSFGKPAPAKLAAENLILGLFIYKDRSASPAGILFLSLVSASMQSGPKAPTQTFVSWRPSDTDICQLEACVGLRLSLVFDSFVAPGKTLRAPIRNQSVGPVVHLTEHELAFKIINYFDDSAVDQVEFQRVTYKDTFPDNRTLGTSY